MTKSETLYCRQSTRPAKLAFISRQGSWSENVLTISVNCDRISLWCVSLFSLWCNWIMLSDLCPMTPRRRIIEGTIRRDSGNSGCSALCCKKGLSIPISIAKGDKLTFVAFPPLYAMINNSPSHVHMSSWWMAAMKTSAPSAFCLPSNPSSLQLECLAIAQTPSAYSRLDAFACVFVAARKSRREDDNSMLKHF